MEFMSTLQARFTSLESDVQKYFVEHGAAFKDGESLVQIKFMKLFMRKLSDFDWGQLGETTEVYDMGLHQEMDEENAKKAEAC